ncbi:hypothetical protein SEA_OMNICRITICAL_56 [Mycobacterium phage OmniCritical]|uniref:DUF6378 domain-containing protein n=3 Tax=Fionnbharthvirus fionnbharth TaxID=2955891 RepID=A0A1J0MDM0_9CAUD|nr:phosphofructokinase [Mycobacterium phage Cheetobro]ALA46328.1 hypothetical protein PBI_SLARP_57 [Mycobacterium phage Slarp]APD19185.1 hypothetical protein SEA_MITTI_57 [Mycobacterium phage Mitti]ASR87764.1 hypothetical protein WINTERMUTE_57 [Mycobacterium phage Wintermute]ASW31736.1 hypothetical protein SEA_CHANCELLOR_57 [Mycobacterium phage Chancellor]AVR77370.1 hypothetical protein SEA_SAMSCHEPPERS_55 [Mycobacterium phage SamScheppers]QGH80338.1 hypothetical protein SEA_MALTHUS_58 [Mycob
MTEAGDPTMWRDDDSKAAQLLGDAGDLSVTFNRWLPGDPVPVPENVLQEAQRLIFGDREQQYGNPSESFDRIAGLWSAYIGTELNGLDVANLMILLKVSRTKGTYHRDSYVDIAGYAGLGERLHEAAQR